MNKSILNLIKVFIAYSILLLIFLKVINEQVYFFKVLISSFLAAFVLLIYLICWSKENREIKIISLFFSIFFHLVIVFYFPLTIDRSVSYHLLTELNNQNEKFEVSFEDMRNIISNYTNDQNFLEKRLDEQLQLGNISNNPKGYFISNRGKNLISTIRFISNIYSYEK